MFHAVDIALTQVGIVEATGNNDGPPADRYMRGDKLAWCAGFVMWVFDQADDDVSVYDSEANWWRYRKVSTMQAGLRKRGLWFGPRLRPCANDIVFFGDRGASDAGSGSHVGLVVGVDDEFIHTVEGNMSDAVKMLRHRRSSKRITGYGRVMDTPREYLLAA